MNKFNYKQFSIGDFVEVTKLVQRSADNKTKPVSMWNIPDGKKLLRDGKKTRLGVITGVKYMPLGCTDYDEEYGHFFCKNGSVTVWRVRFGLAGAEWCALPEDLTPCDTPKQFPIATVIWTKRDKEMLSDIMKDEPRDDKGRFA